MRVGDGHPLRPLTSLWVSKIKKAWDKKKKEFQNDADEAMRFFNGPYDWIYDSRNARNPGAFTFTGDEVEMPRLSFAMTVNKAAELVQLFGPALYHRNPVRQVNPRIFWKPDIELIGDPNDPQVQAYHAQISSIVNQGRHVDSARAALIQGYLNYTPNALDLKTESRFAIVEALLKGMGCLWTETYKPAGSSMNMVGSFFDTVDNLIIDPDAEIIRDARWIARRYIQPFWDVERKYGHPTGSLRGVSSMESSGQQGSVSASPTGDYDRKTGQTNDLIVYWKIYSKMGAGGLLSGSKPDMAERLDGLGQYVCLAVTADCGYPLNITPEASAALLSDDPYLVENAIKFVREEVAWPTPFWTDDSWPFTPIYFHSVPRHVWPMSHLRPGMGELKFLNWVYSMMAGKVKNACRDFIAVAKSAGEELKDRIRSGPDYTMIEIEAIHDDIDRVVKFLQHPPFNREIYEVAERITDNFEKRTGLTELLYGLSNNQLRSAEEAALKGDQVSVRPDDMANKIEESMTEAARKEAFCARWHLRGDDVSSVLGPVAGQWWDQLFTTTDPGIVLYNLDYRIEAGSARKPNKARDVANMQQAVQTLFGPLFSYAQATGDIDPVNALVTAWAKSIDMDASRFLLKPPPPPPEMQQGAQGGLPPLPLSMMQGGMK